MATLSGAASFKKKQGMVSIFEEQTPPLLQWKAIDNNVEVKEISIQLDQVTNLQATPLSSAKLALNIITGEKKNVFSFNSRDTMNNIKNLLQQIIARKKQDKEGSATATPVPQLQVVNDEFLLNLLDAKKLLKNHQLQQRLLKENKNLMNTFREAVMNNGLDPLEFWNTRIHLLRSYAIQHNQKKGSYNVLSTIKPVATSDNEVNVSVTREKIHSIFEQYPIVRKIYNDNVPKKFGEGVFWSRFFSSKLFRKLRGEKNYNNAKVDATFDKYLYVDPDYEGEDEELQQQQQHQQQHHVNKFIDLEGNEEDVSEKLGNSQDFTMRFDKNQDTISILKSMNRLSKKMVSNFEDDIEEEEENELELSDLEDKEVPEYNELTIKKNINIGNEVKLAKLDKDQYLQYIDTIKNEFQENIELEDLINNPDSKKQIMELTREISNLVRTNARQSRQSWQINIALQDDAILQLQLASHAIEEEEVAMNQELLENLRLCHSTSIEFLRHFWLNLQDQSCSEKILQNLYHGLQKSLQRVETILNSAKFEQQDLQIALQTIQPLRDSLKFAITHYENLIIEAKSHSNLKHKLIHS